LELEGVVLGNRVAMWLDRKILVMTGLLVTKYSGMFQSIHGRLEVAMGCTVWKIGSCHCLSGSLGVAMGCTV
jgi:hypothetical protein